MSKYNKRFISFKTVNVPKQKSFMEQLEDFVKKIEISIKVGVFFSTTDALFALSNDKGHLLKGFGFANSIAFISRKSKGWIKQYKFCNNNKVISDWNYVLEDNFLSLKKTTFGC